MPVLGVFQRLIASKSNDHYAFFILNSLTIHLPPALFSEYIKQILYLLFQRLNSSKTTKLVKNMLVFLSLYAYKYSPAQLFDLVDALQPGMSLMVIEKLFVIDLQKVSGRVDRKICAVGTAKILAECQFLLGNEANLKVWAALLEALVGLFELPEELVGGEEDNFIDVEETPGYQSAFNQLHSASRREQDPFEGQVGDAKVYLAGQLKALSTGVTFSVGQLLGNLSIESQKHLQAYLSQANVQLN
jgi:exportin-2 (importin alpha re-exporter)